MLINRLRRTLPSPVGTQTQPALFGPGHLLVEAVWGIVFVHGLRLMQGLQGREGYYLVLCLQRNLTVLLRLVDAWDEEDLAAVPTLVEASPSLITLSGQVQRLRAR